MTDEIIKQISLMNSEGNLVPYDIGAKAENVSYGESSNVKETLNDINNNKQNKELTSPISVQGQICETVEETLIALNQNASGSVDTEMSDSSTNPVQNCTIKEYVDSQISNNITQVILNTEF